MIAIHYFMQQNPQYFARTSFSRVLANRITRYKSQGGGGGGGTRGGGGGAVVLSFFLHT